MSKDVSDEQMRKWVDDAIHTIRDTAKNIPDPTEYDDRIQEDIRWFLKDPTFFSIPLTVICRNIKKANIKFSPSEAAFAIENTIKYHKEKGFMIMYYIELDNPESGEDAFEAIKSLSNCNIIKNIIDHPFEAPSKERSEYEIELEEKEAKRKVLMTETSKKANTATEEVNNMRARIKELEKYKKRNKGWPNERKELESAITTLEEDNRDLEKDNQSWKNAAFRKFDTPKNFNSDIFDACKKGDAESVIFLIDKDKEIVNKIKNGPNSENYTPLMIACKYGKVAVALVLINNGAKVNHKEWHGTPLSYAEESGDEELINLLKENGAIE